MANYVFSPEVVLIVQDHEVRSSLSPASLELFQVPAVQGTPQLRLTNINDSQAPHNLHASWFIYALVRGMQVQRCYAYQTTINSSQLEKFT